MNWIQSAIMGLVSGLCEPMPLSAAAHRAMLGHMFGLEEMQLWQQLFSHLVCAIVVLSAGRLELSRLRRTWKQLRTPPRRRTGRPDPNSAGTIRLLRWAIPLAVLGAIVSNRLILLTGRLWLLAILLLLSGVLLWVPSLVRTGNKDGRHLTALEGLSLGLGGLLAAVPGFSVVGSVAAIGSMIGARKEYALRIGWILLTVRLLTAAVMNAAALAAAGFTASTSVLIAAGLGAAAAGFGTWLGIHLIRALVRSSHAEPGSFCYYNWGQALLCLALFLLV